MSLPRTDATDRELAEAFTMLALAIGPEIRDEVKATCLRLGHNAGMRTLLKCLNDFDRVNDWRAKHPDEAARLAEPRP